MLKYFSYIYHPQEYTLKFIRNILLFYVKFNYRKCSNKCPLSNKCPTLINVNFELEQGGQWFLKSLNSLELFLNFIGS